MSSLVLICIYDQYLCNNNIARHMQDLPLVLASRELFLSLSTLKLKTLKQAQELNKQHKNIKIEELLKEYQKIKGKVGLQFKSQGVMEWNHCLPSQFEKDPLKYYLTRPTILEIVGGKGNGKTALLLRLILEYHSFNSNSRIILLNCGGGITLDRMARLSKTGCGYYDIFGVEDLLQFLNNCKKESNCGLIAIDSAANLLLGYQRNRIGMGQTFLSLKCTGWSVYYTNYTQGRLQVEEKQASNCTGYFSQTFGGVPQCKLTIEPQTRTENSFSVKMIKSIDSKYYCFSGEMGPNGLDGLSLRRAS